MPGCFPITKIVRFYYLVKFNYYTDLGVCFRHFQTRDQLNLIREQLCNEIVRTLLNRDELVSERDPLLKEPIEKLHDEYIRLMNGLEILNMVTYRQLF